MRTTWSLVFVLASIFGFRTSSFGNTTPVPVYSILEKEQKITLHPDYSYIIAIKQNTLITDQRGLSHGEYRFVLDEFTKVEHFEARLVNVVTGKVLKKIREKDLKSRALISEGSFFQNLQLFYFTLDQIALPLKVELEVKLRKTGNFNIPTWYPTSHYSQKVKKATLEVNYPEHVGFRYKSGLKAIQSEETVAGATRQVRWEVTNLEALDKKTTSEELPKVELAPLKFAMQGYEATMDSWQSFGNWFNLLNEGKDELPEATKKLVREMVSEATDDFDKVSILYRYLQKNYRYVSIQLGIGGWMPMKAAEVVANKYGDCKGLSMLMKALLKEAGIASDYTLVLAGDDEDPIDLDFPSNQFNHAILRVPLENETVWLECTSSTLPPGYLGSFTKNRPVLSITPKGGEINYTPSYNDAKYNTSSVSMEIDLAENGDASITGKSYFQGIPAEDFVQIKYYLGEKERKDYLDSNLGGPGLLLGSYDLNTSTARDLSTAEVTFEGMIARYSQNTAKRVIMPLSWSAAFSLDPDTYVLDFEEEVTIKTPVQLIWESGAEGWDEETPYFSVKIETQLVDDKLKINKKIRVNFPEDLSGEERESHTKHIKAILYKQLIFKK